jgi:DNA polymerase/3'-5' exonuclease PolX
MLNEKIINEFKKLIAFVKNDSDELKKAKDVKKLTANNFRLKQLNNVLIVLNNYPEKITLKNYIELKEIDGIGAHTIERLKEIVENGKLEELSTFTEKDQGKETILKELETIIGVGRAKAVEFYDQGITSVKMLKQKIEKKEIEVNDKIELGLKYWGKAFPNIHRKEIEKFYKIFTKIVDKMKKVASPSMPTQ